MNPKNTKESLNWGDINLLWGEIETNRKNKTSVETEFNYIDDVKRELTTIVPYTVS